MVTRGITHLATDTLSVLVIQSVISLLPLGRYLLPLSTLNGNQPIDSSRKSLFTTISKNVSIVRYGMSLVTKQLLDLVMNHWICWIQRESHLGKTQLRRDCENLYNSIKTCSCIVFMWLCSNHPKLSRLHYSPHSLASFEIQAKTSTLL